MEAFRQEYADVARAMAGSPSRRRVWRASQHRIAPLAAPKSGGATELAQTDILLLFVGMNFEVKGLDTIIAALAKARTAQARGEHPATRGGPGR